MQDVKWFLMYPSKKYKIRLDSKVQIMYSNFIIHYVPCLNFGFGGGGVPGI